MAAAKAARAGEYRAKSASIQHILSLAVEGLQGENFENTIHRELRELELAYDKLADAHDASAKHYTDMAEHVKNHDTVIDKLLKETKDAYDAAAAKETNAAEKEEKGNAAARKYGHDQGQTDLDLFNNRFSEILGAHNGISLPEAKLTAVSDPGGGDNPIKGVTDAAKEFKPSSMPDMGNMGDAMNAKPQPGMDASQQEPTTDSSLHTAGAAGPSQGLSEVPSSSTPTTPGWHGAGNAGMLSSGSAAQASFNFPPSSLAVASAAGVSSPLGSNMGVPRNRTRAPKRYNLPSGMSMARAEEILQEIAGQNDWYACAHLILASIRSGYYELDSVLLNPLDIAVGVYRTGEGAVKTFYFTSAGKAFIELPLTLVGNPYVDCSHTVFQMENPGLNVAMQAHNFGTYMHYDTQAIVSTVDVGQALFTNQFQTNEQLAALIVSGKLYETPNHPLSFINPALYLEAAKFNTDRHLALTISKKALDTIGGRETQLLRDQISLVEA